MVTDDPGVLELRVRVGNLEVALKHQHQKLETLHVQMLKLVRDLAWQLTPGNPILPGERTSDCDPEHVGLDEEIVEEPRRIPACRQCQCPVSHAETLCDMCLESQGG